LAGESTVLDQAARTCQRACRAKCCRYITTVLEPPRRKVDFDELGWFVSHEGVSVYVQGRRWHLQVATRCRYLTPGNLCAIYDTRPDVCRDYDPKDCEHDAKLEYSLYFDTKDDFDRWYAKRLERQRKRRRAASRR
jgi:Fe-S-cluster containining protein